MFHCTAFNELIELVKAYKSRTFDEEITAIENQEGKSDSADRFVVHQYDFRFFLLSLIHLYSLVMQVPKASVTSLKWMYPRASRATRSRTEQHFLETIIVPLK